MKIKSIAPKIALISFLFADFGGLTSVQDKPIFILLMAMDISTYIECSGMSGVKTPNPIELADEGIKFTRTCYTDSICSPNHSAMLTGVDHRSNKV